MPNIDDLKTSGATITDKVMKLFSTKEKEPLTAQMAWYCSKHGNGAYKGLDERIVTKRNQIDCAIRDKFEPLYVNDRMVRCPQANYHCLVEIEEDLIESTDLIFKPFVDGGFDVKELEEYSYADMKVFIISWKNAFKKKN